MANLLNVFLCVRSTAGDVCCDLLSVRENKAARESSFQSFCKAASLRWSGWFAQSFLCQWEDFLWFFRSKRERCSTWPGDGLWRWAVEDATSR